MCIHNLRFELKLENCHNCSPKNCQIFSSENYSNRVCVKVMGFNQLVQSEFYQSSPCSQLMALSTGKLPLGGLLRNSVVG